MSFYQESSQLRYRFRLVLGFVLQAEGLPFADLLTEDDIQKAFDDEEVSFASRADEFFTPAITKYLKEGDIVLADRYYCSYFMIAPLASVKVDFVGRMHQLRKTDPKQRTRLAPSDYLVTWYRPQRPTRMDEETYDRVPESITLRQVEVEVREPGFRVRKLTVVTTLLDAEQYSRDSIAELYQKRWQVELDIRAIKVSMGMDVLRCKSPAMVRKEIWACILAYNLIRKTMLQAAKRHHLFPRQLSFTTVMQTLAASWCVIPILDPATRRVMIEAQIDSLASQIVGKPDRANRVEPRAVKRRPKPHPLLTMPRDTAKKLLSRGVNPFDKQ